MNLKDLDKKNVASRALKESFSLDLNLSNLNRAKTVSMLNKVTKLIKESKKSSDFYKTLNSPAYLKLVFMEQALVQHLATVPAAKIVVENTEVEKSQVILAAQDMVDSIQKMYEDVNDMIVKELPALTSSIESEIGVNESTQFNQTASDALNTLNDALQQAKAGLQGALGNITGQVTPDTFGAGEVTEPAAGEEDIDLDIDTETPPVPEVPEEEPEETGASVGRAKR